MSDNEEIERTRDFVRSKRRPVRRTAGPRSGSVITSSPATRRGQDQGASDDDEPPATRGRPAPRRECLSHVAGYPVLALVAGYLPQTAEHSSAAVSVCRAFRDVALPMLRAERRLWRLRRKSFCVQADLTAALLLSAEAVRAVPHREQRDRTGKVRKREFATEISFRRLLAAHGGAAGLDARVAKQARRKERADARRAALRQRLVRALEARGLPPNYVDRHTLMREHVESSGRKHSFDDLLRLMDSWQGPYTRKLELVKGLRHLGLSLRGDSQTCEDYIRGRSQDSLYHVLETMTRMHWLHSHTGGAYKRAVDERVESYREWEGRTYPGIYRDVVDEVQHMDRFRHLPARLPWLPQYASSGAALDAAVAAARGS